MHSSFYTLADSRSISLLLPSLLNPEAVGLNTPQTPYLCRFLSHARASISPVESLELIVSKWFNGDNGSQQNCAAVIGYQLEFEGRDMPTFVLRADPVFQQMDINHAVLADQSVLALQLDEALALAETFNRHFESDGISFDVAQANHWYCRFEEPLVIQTRPLSEAVGCDVATQSPVGPDAKKWRGFLAEIEMLLYSHPVNLHRQSVGDAVINSLWLWGEGVPVPVTSIDPSKIGVYAENFYTKSIAHRFDLPVARLPSFFECNACEEAVLLVDDRLIQAASTADEILRADVLQQLEVHVFAPLWHKLGHRGFLSIRIWTGGEQWLQVDSSARVRFWRKQKPLSHYIELHSAGDHDR